MTDNDTNYITLEDAARLLGKSQRTVYRYAEQGRLNTHDTPAGKLFERSQVETLAAELNVTPQPVQPVTELVPLSDMLAALERERERTQDKERMINQLMVRISDLREEIGRLEERTETQQRALTDLDMARQRAIALEQLNAELQAQLEAAKQPTQHAASEHPAPDAEPTPQAADQSAKRVPWWRKWFADI
jgi:excisionase family DNA binding protein